MVLQDVGLGSVAQSLAAAVVLPLAAALWGRFSGWAQKRKCAAEGPIDLQNL